MSDNMVIFFYLFVGFWVALFLRLNNKEKEPILIIFLHILLWPLVLALLFVAFLLEAEI